MTTVGEVLVGALEARGVRVVFGIPGVHTVELYRGLGASSIRHVTPRHEQGAGFMADGYARVSGLPGVAFVITGPGITNTLTPMGQARADSIPMLVISGVNRKDTLGKGLGHLHELPDQRGMAALVALTSERVESAGDLAGAIDRAFARIATGRPGPVHIEVPLDVMGLPADPLAGQESADPVAGDPAAVAGAARMLGAARSPVILAGGGARFAGEALQAVAERLDAPVVQTVNARGLMHGHPLCVPASPSLEAVRDLVHAADVVLAVGTEFGPTDYDMYGDGRLPQPKRLVRIDIDAEQIARHPVDVALNGHAEAVLPALFEVLPDVANNDGAVRAEVARNAAWAALDPVMRSQIEILNAVRNTIPGAIIVGDSTQAIYAGNLYYDHDRPAGWFNAATGFGALGYAIPAAIGAALARPEAPIICIAGDGGAQFTLPELMTAVDEKLPIVFLVWNNRGYQEIAHSMESAGVTVTGCHPTPPDFEGVAQSCAMAYRRAAMTPDSVAHAIRDLREPDGPVLIEIDAAN